MNRIAIVMAAAMLSGSAWAAPGAVLGTASLLGGAITTWYGVAAAAAVAVIAVSALVYMLSNALGLGNAAQAWARTQIYEAALGLVFMAILLGFYSSMLLNPQPYFTAANLVPMTCSSSSESTMFHLAACDMATFITMSEGMFNLLYYASFVGGATPKLNIKYTIPGSVDVGVSTSVKVFPKAGEDMLSIGFNFLLFMLALNEIQMILISAAPLLFSMLISIGVIAWIVGFSRRFGGAMIAFALGFGIVYPLLVSITYGYMDGAIIQNFNTFLCTTCQITAGSFAVDLAAKSLAALPSFIGGMMGTFITGTLWSGTGYYLLQFGYLFAGLTFIPFINFMILDSFVLDISRVLGERVSFMALIGSLV